MTLADALYRTLRMQIPLQDAERTELLLVQAVQRLVALEQARRDAIETVAALNIENPALAVGDAMAAVDAERKEAVRGES